MRPASTFLVIQLLNSRSMLFSLSIPELSGKARLTHPTGKFKSCIAPIILRCYNNNI